MGIVKNNYELEDYLYRKGVQWRSLKDAEYRGVMKKWKLSFELLLDESIETKGDEGVNRLVNKLPFNAFIFNVPSYSYLPLTPPRNTPTYGIYVENFDEIDRMMLNSCEAVVCDDRFTFMCAFNHEAQDLVPEVYCEID